MSAALGASAPAEGTLSGFVYRQYAWRKSLPSSVRLEGRLAVVTGGNVGLGLEASRQLLSRGLSRLVMASRSEERGARAAEALRAEFPTATVDVWQLDMASYDSVVAFARRCDDELPTIDYVLLNAGVQHLGFRVADATGHESTLQVNYLSTALLAVLLASVLRRKGATNATDGRAPVLAAVGSEGQYLAELPAPGPVLAPLDCQRAGFVGFKQYLVSKLLLMAFMARLAEHVSPDDVVVTVVNPGLTGGSELGRETFQSKAWHIRFLVPLLMKLLARSLAVGASCYLDGMLVQAKAGHGSFCSEWSIKSYVSSRPLIARRSCKYSTLLTSYCRWPAALYTEEGKSMQDRLWQETLEELNFSEAATIIAGMSKA